MGFVIIAAAHLVWASVATCRLAGHLVVFSALAPQPVKRGAQR